MFLQVQEPGRDGRLSRCLYQGGRGRGGRGGQHGRAACGRGQEAGRRGGGAGRGRAPAYMSATGQPARVLVMTWSAELDKSTVSCISLCCTAAPAVSLRLT